MKNKRLKECNESTDEHQKIIDAGYIIKFKTEIEKNSAEICKNCKNCDNGFRGIDHPKVTTRCKICEKTVSPWRPAIDCPYKKFSKILDRPHSPSEEELEDFWNNK